VGDRADREENASNVALPPGMRAASSGAHDLVALGGASALGSVASFGWIAPQAVNSRAEPASAALSCTVVDFDKRAAMGQTGDCGRA